MHIADGEHAARLSHREVDRRPLPVEVVVEIAAVAAGEAVRQLLSARLDLEHRLEVGPERPDHLVASKAVRRRNGHHAGSTAGGVCTRATVSCSTYTRSMSRSRSGRFSESQMVRTTPAAIQATATQFAYFRAKPMSGPHFQ